MSFLSPLYTRRALELLLDWVAPPTCVGCGANFGAGGGVFCSSCRPAWYVAGRAIEGVPLFSAYSYDEPLVREALSRFKFRDRPELGRLLARELVIAPCMTDSVWLESAHFVPVPADPARLVSRKYNQATLLAQGLALKVRGRVHPSLLKRKTSDRAQTQLNKRERETNVQIMLRRKHMRAPGVATTPLVLVDDVCSTGATLRACIRCLFDSGLAVQSAIVFADNS